MHRWAGHRRLGQPSPRGRLQQAGVTHEFLRNPQLLEGGFAAGSQPIVEVQAAADDAAHLLRDVLWHVWRPSVHEHLAREVRQRRDVLVGQRAAQNLDKDATHGPHVDLLGDLRLAIKELRSHVPRRAAVVLLGDVGALHRLGQAEVTDLDVQVEVQHNVQGLEVAVDNGRGLRVQVHHPIRDLQAHVGGVQPGELQLPDVEEVVQGAAWHVLRHQAQVRHLQASADEAHQALVAKVPEGLNLLGQVLHDQLRHGVVPVELLDGYLLVAVATPEHLPELARAQRLDELEVRVLDLLGRRQAPLKRLPRRGLALGKCRHRHCRHRRRNRRHRRCHRRWRQAGGCARRLVGACLADRHRLPGAARSRGGARQDGCSARR
mmetsp:Transcript_67986/g.180941  ORF Transcript_67986/g.180941 Transcript_67986/m.180941 type:complete len:377 (-) Transcript_67986:884-2014(-)